YRKSTDVPTGSPVTVVLAWSEEGALTHVFPPSVLYCHSYDARRAAIVAVSFAVPETSPGLAPKTRVARGVTLRTGIPALWMIVAPFSGVASAMACTSPPRGLIGETTTARLSLRAAALPLALVRARVSAACRSLTAAERTESAGTGVGNAGLLVIA